VGKTQLVIELAYRVTKKQCDCSVFWIPATDLESLHQAYLAVAENLGIPGLDKPGADVKLLVKQYFSKSSTGRWLLIFDNADDLDMWIKKPSSELGAGRRLLDYLPKSTQGSIVFTTRDRRIAVKLAPQNVVEVSEMSDETAKKLLKKCLINAHPTDTNHGIETILAQLTYLPLAIVQASSYINENGISITDYLKLLADKDDTIIELLSEDFEDDGRYENIKNPVATTWLISFERILHRDALAAEYLSFMACVEPKDIPESLLPNGPSRKKQTEAIGTLSAYAFVSRRSGGTVLDLHRLVHLATRNWLLENGQMTKWAAKAVSRLAEVFPNDEHRNRAEWRGYLSHATYALASMYVRQDRDDHVELLQKLGLCLLSDGRFDEASGHLLEVMETREKVLGIDHPDTLMSVSNLAGVLDRQGKYEESEELNQRVLAVSEKVLGVDHPHTLTSVSNLAGVLERQGKYKESEELNQRALAVSEKVLGVDHPDTLMSVNNLAGVLDRQGKYEESEQLNQRALAVKEKVLGVNHPSTLMSVSNLALVLDRQGKYEESEQLNQRALAAREKVLGVDHPDTLMSVNNLAGVLERQGKYEESEQLNQRALAVKEKVLGVDHPDTLMSVSNLALVLDRQGKYKESEQLNRRVLAVSEKVLGVDHPHTLTSVSNLAGVLDRQGKYEESEQLNRRALAAREKVLGVDHPDTLMSVYCLAYLLQNMKQNESAADLYQRACSGFERVLGHSHPTTISCLNHYANLRKDM
jgi:tetratricopeptide (TPR) repeat protein